MACNVSGLVAGPCVMHCFLGQILVKGCYVEINTAFHRNTLILLMRAIASHSQLSTLANGPLTRSPGTASARLTRTRSSTAPSSWKQWQAAPAWSEHTPNCCFVMIYSKLSQTSSVSTYGSCSMCALPPVSPPCLPNYSQFDSCAPVFRLCARSLPCLTHRHSRQVACFATFVLSVGWTTTMAGSTPYSKKLRMSACICSRSSSSSNPVPYFA